MRTIPGRRHPPRRPPGWGSTARSVGTGQRGSVLMLVPALVLVLLVLGAIAVDSAGSWLGHRELVDFATSAADTAANQAIDRSVFYGANGTLRIDPVIAQRVVDRLRSAETGGGLTVLSATAAVSPDGRTVTVVATGLVHHLFAGAVGGRGESIVRAAAQAVLQEVRVTPALPVAQP